VKDNQYIEAYKIAPVQTKKLIVKYMSMPKSFRDKKPLLYYILGAGTPPYKMGRNESHYTDVSTVPFQDCANCIFAFQSVLKKHYICSQIRGNIEPKGWCHLWNR